MSFVPVTVVTTTTAAAAMARKRKLAEEEELTRYDEDDLQGWEFKIVRVARPRYRDAEFVRAVRAEEAAAGWQMVEKFDEHRIRFKRKVEHREGDGHRKLDPYRTQIGMRDDTLGVVSAVGFLVGLAVLGLGLYLAYSFWGG